MSFQVQEELERIQFPWDKINTVTLSDIIKPVSSKKRCLYTPIDDLVKQVVSDLESIKKSALNKNQAAEVSNYIRQSRPDLYYQQPGGCLIQRIGPAYRSIYKQYGKSSSPPKNVIHNMTANGIKIALTEAGYQDVYNTHTRLPELRILYDKYITENLDKDEPKNKCDVDGCNDEAIYGLYVKKPIRCEKHKDNNMFDVCEGYCIECDQEATHSKSKEFAKKIYCPKHGKEKGGYLRAPLCIECEETYPSYFYNDKKCLCSKCATQYPEKYPDATSSKKLCETPNCNTSASYGYETDRIRRWCSKCGKNKEGVVPLTHTMCVLCGTVRASYADNGDDKPKYCKSCAIKHEKNVVDVVTKKCEICNEKPAYYGCSESTIKRWCVDCKDKVGKPSELKTSRCKHPGCKTQPSYGLPGGKITHCKGHSTSEMVVLRKPMKCKNCDSKPTHGYKGHLTHCVNCKKDDMVRYQNFYCHVDGCDIIPTFAYKKGEDPISCKRHMEPGMVDVCNRMCLKCKTKQANYGDPELGIRVYCNDCKEFGQISLKHRRCIDCGLCIVHGNKVRCATCSGTGWSREKELSVVNYLKGLGDDYSCFIHNKAVPRSLFRPDILYAISDDSTKDVLWYLIVEVDENQHKANDPEAEEERMYSIHQVLGKPCTFIRYNPDPFSIDGKRMSKEYPTEKRLELLKKKVNRHMSRQPVGVHVCKICFDDYVISGYELNYTPHV